MVGTPELPVAAQRADQASAQSARPAAAPGQVEEPAAFDALADRYDALFSDPPLGQVLRRSVWRHVDPLFRSGMRVLDLGCGTGEDALHLAARGVEVLALDASAAMIRAAGAKVLAAGLGDRVRLAQLDMARRGGLDRLSTAAFDGAAVDGALANFGVLNCLSDKALRELGTGLASRIQPTGHLIAVVMGPRCAWELLWYAAHGDFRRATRRMKSGGVIAELGSGPLTVHYPSARSLSDVFAPQFRLVETAAIGCALPPGYAAGWFQRRSRALAWLARVDRRIERWPAAVALADHYLARFERTDSA